MNRTTIVSLLLVALCLLAAPAAAQTPSSPAPAATPRPTTVLVVNYMKVKGDIAGLQRELWMPIHKESVKEGKLKWWSSWSVRWAGTASEYDFLTVDAYHKWADLEKAPWTSETWAKVHPGVKLEEVGKRTNAARDIVRRDVLMLIAETETPAGAAPAKYVVVDFYKTTPEKTRDYVQLERETYLPMHQEVVKQGKLAFWQFYFVRGTGSESSYNFVTVRGYSKWEDIGAGGGPAVLAKVHPNLKLEDLNQRVMAARTLAKSQTLTLVDQVPPAPAGQ